MSITIKMFEEYPRYTRTITGECSYGCSPTTYEHRINTMRLEQGVSNDLYKQLKNLPYKALPTMYSHLEDWELWNNTYSWNDPVEALREVITRTVKNTNDTLNLDYTVSLYIYQTIMADERFTENYTEGQYWDAKYTYNQNEELLLQQLIFGA